MPRVLLFFLPLVLALAGWQVSTAGDGFYAIPVLRGNYAPVPKTGQTYSYYPGDDGDLEKGVVWPSPRLVDNGNGTVTDRLTGLVWLKSANSFVSRTWAEALNDAATLADGVSGLTDGSRTGDWRLPHIREMQSLTPSLPADHPFTDVGGLYWSSTTYASAPNNGAWGFDFASANRVAVGKSNRHRAWFVRDAR
jgi:hypothetical protein